MNRIDGNALDRYITGNYGADQYDRWPEYPEDANCKACEGEGCEACDNSGIDPAKREEYDRIAAEHERAQAELEEQLYQEAKARGEDV